MKPSLAPRVSEWTEGENCRNVEPERKAERKEGERELRGTLRDSTSFTRRNFPPRKSFRANARRVKRTHCKHEILFAVVVSIAGRPGRQELRQSLLRRRWWVLVWYCLFSYCFRSCSASEIRDSKTRGKIRIRTKRVRECRESFWNFYHGSRMFAFCHCDWHTL